MNQNSKIIKAWNERSLKYKDSLAGVLPKSFPILVNKYLDEWMFDQIKVVVDRNKNLKILDIGCGYGRLSEKILNNFPKAATYGVDVAQKYVDLYNEKLSPRGKAYLGEATQLPFKDSSFDVVIIVAALMYVINKGDQKKAILEIKRVLKKNGKLVIIERNPVGYYLIAMSGLVVKLRGTKRAEIQSVSFLPKDILNLVGGINKEIEFKGIPAFTLFLPVMFLLNLINQRVLKLFLSVIRILDKKFEKSLTHSLYIAYTLSSK